MSELKEFRETRTCRGADDCSAAPILMTLVRRKDGDRGSKVVDVVCRYRKGKGCLETVNKNPSGKPTKRCRYIPR